MKEIFLAGGCYWGVEKYLGNIHGVMETEVGFANGTVGSPSYEEVKHGDTGHAETVRVVYDDEQLPLPALLRLFYKIIDPTAVDRQGGDVGHQYRTGVYYSNEGDRPAVEASLAELQEAVRPRRVAVECLPLRCFYPAEEYHQKYLEKNPGGYCHIGSCFFG